MNETQDMNKASDKKRKKLAQRSKQFTKSQLNDISDTTTLLIERSIMETAAVLVMFAG